MSGAAWVLVVLGYVVGSLPFGLWIARLFGGIDIRKVGSGNIGATNVGRVMGFRWFVVVFLLDALKGLLPTLTAAWFTFSGPGDQVSTLVPVLVGLAAILGHMYPCWLGFRGGKGVATALGVVLMLAPASSAITAAVFGISFAAWRIVSLSSLLAAVTFAVAQMFLLRPGPFAAGIWPTGLFSLLVPALVIVRHRSNIVRLLRGEEHGFRKSEQRSVSERNSAELTPLLPSEPGKSETAETAGTSVDQ